jgi:DHA2 family multidrug resistance protein-like MFS transporter
VFTLATDLVVGAAPPEQAGAASAISETGSELGGALGIAILGSVGTAAYRRVMADSLPADVPPEAAALARSTLGGARAAADELQGELGAAVLDVARHSFAESLELAALISAVLLVAMATVAAVRLRSVAPANPAQEQGGSDETVDR